MNTKVIELKPIKESTEDYDEVERRIKILLREQIYVPLIKELGGNRKTLQNATDDLLSAIKYGRIQFYRGTFTGRFNAGISKELKALGARWDRQTGTWKLSSASLPSQVRMAVQASESHFRQKVESIDKKLAAILPGEISEKLKVAELFDTTLWKVEREFQATVKGIAVLPKLTKEQRKKIADDWQNNLKLYVKDWTQKEIVQLRKDMQESVFAGNRYDSAAKMIQKSYQESSNKAKFLARQETGLLMAKFKEVRYKDAGVKKFIWKCVTGTTNHPVRDTHKICDNKIFSWDNPGELDKSGVVKAGGVQKPAGGKNPGEDYNCRCYAKPIVEFGKV